jgi:hypothetical protein
MLHYYLFHVDAHCASARQARLSRLSSLHQLFTTLALSYPISTLQSPILIRTAQPRRITRIPVLLTRPSSFLLSHACRTVARCPRHAFLSGSRKSALPTLLTVHVEPLLGPRVHRCHFAITKVVVLLLL